MIVLHGNVMCEPIVLDYGWVIDGNVSDALVEIRNRVTTNVHHLLHKRIGVRHSRRWIVNELSLRSLPRIGKFISLLIGQRLEFQFLHARLTLLQNFLSGCRITFSTRHSPVLRPEVCTQPLAALVRCVQPNTYRNRND